jgi:hypothetical protein
MGDLLSIVAFACSLTPTQNLSFRPEQFALFANCAAEKPASLPIPSLRRNLAVAFVVAVLPCRSAPKTCQAPKPLIANIPKHIPIA